MAYQIRLWQHLPDDTSQKVVGGPEDGYVVYDSIGIGKTYTYVDSFPIKTGDTLPIWRACAIEWVDGNMRVTFKNEGSVSVQALEPI